MGGVSIWHWIVVGVIVLLLFGRGKVSDLMGDVAQGIKAFKKGLADDTSTPKSKSVDHQPTPTVVDPLQTRVDPVDQRPV